MSDETAENGWRNYHNPYWRPGMPLPRDHERIWIWREGWEKPSLTSHDQIHPATNVIGLLWKPAEALN